MKPFKLRMRKNRAVQLEILALSAPRVKTQVSDPTVTRDFPRMQTTNGLHHISSVLSNDSEKEVLCVFFLHFPQVSEKIWNNCLSLCFESLTGTLRHWDTLIFNYRRV